MNTEQKYIHNVTVTKVPIYDIPVYFVISNDQQKCQKFLGDFKFSSFCAGEFVDNRNMYGLFIILNPYNNAHPLYNGIITHEAVHATLSLFAKIGIELKTLDSETMAYHTEWFVDRIYAILKKLNLLDKVAIKK